jgi:phosphoglycolate phosphatase-like HAD superfamily hydrolase
VVPRRALSIETPWKDRGMRGVLFDAGGVLVRPVGGRWNPRYDFEAIAERHHPSLIGRDLGGAFAAGQRVLDAGTTTADRTDYHRAILRELGIATPSADLLRELKAPPAGPVLELYPDARPALERLRAAGVAMAVVSDTWAGLDEAFRQLGVAEFFTAPWTATPPARPPGWSRRSTAFGNALRLTNRVENAGAAPTEG